MDAEDHDFVTEVNTFDNINHAKASAPVDPVPTQLTFVPYFTVIDVPESALFSGGVPVVTGTPSGAVFTPFGWALHPIMPLGRQPSGGPVLIPGLDGAPSDGHPASVLGPHRGTDAIGEVYGIWHGLPRRYTHQQWS
jgi:hypothetical protein